MRKNKIRILHVAQAAGGVDRYIRMLLKYLDKEKFENILICSQDFHEEDYKGLVDYFDQVEMTRAIGSNDLKAIKSVRTLIKKYNPDIVYAHSSKAGAIARVADIGLKNHCVYNPHGWAFNMRCSAKKKAVYKDTIEFRRHDNNASSRMAHTSSNRIDRMYKETSIIKNMLNSNFLTKKQVEFISKQYKVYCKRIDLLSRRSVTGIVKMVSVLNYYSRKRLWLTDLYYVLK